MYDANDQLARLVGVVLKDRFELRSVLGAGGMGAVFDGWDRQFDSAVAIKIILPSIATHEGARQELMARFRREAKNTFQLKHQNIVTVTDFGEDSDHEMLFLVMEKLVGKDLDNELRSEGRIAPRRAVKILAQACSAIDFAHQQGQIHRDLKPSNIFLIKRGRENDFVKVLDFGLARGMSGEDKLTGTGQLLGTPHYMAPEQINARFALDQRCDVYAMGAVAYHLLAGTVPFGGTTIAAILVAQQNDTQEPLAKIVPGFPKALSDVVDRALHKRPDARYATMEDFREALEAAVRAMPDGRVTPPSFPVVPHVAPPQGPAPKTIPPLIPSRYNVRPPEDVPVVPSAKSGAKDDIGGWSNPQVRVPPIDGPGSGSASVGGAGAAGAVGPDASAGADHDHAGGAAGAVGADGNRSDADRGAQASPSVARRSTTRRRVAIGAKLDVPTAHAGVMPVQRPTLASLDDGSAALLYESAATGVTRIGAQIVRATSVASPATITKSPSVALSPVATAAEGRVLLAWVDARAKDGTSQIFAGTWQPGRSELVEVALGEPNFRSAAPAIAPTKAGAIVAWHETTGATKTSRVAVALIDRGGKLVSGPVRSINGAYPTVACGDESSLIAWHEAVPSTENRSIRVCSIALAHGTASTPLRWPHTGTAAFPTLAPAPDGTFAMLYWTAEPTPSAMLSRVGRDGTPIGEPLRLGPAAKTPSRGSLIAVAGGFVAAWCGRPTEGIVTMCVPTDFTGPLPDPVMIDDSCPSMATLARIGDDVIAAWPFKTAFAPQLKLTKIALVPV